MKLTKLLGITTFLSYLVSVCILFTTNAHALQEVQYLSVTGYNIEGLAGQSRVMILNYLLPGLLMALFGLSLSKKYKAQTAGKIGSFIFVVSGISWMSFSFSPLYPNGTMNGFDFELLHYIKVFFAWGAGVIALILISSDSKEIGINKTIKWTGIAIAVLMVFEMLYYWFINYSGTISAVSWTVYFMWFALFATQKNLQPTKRILNPR
ncbi:hypothetical protein I2I11_04700 [Pontibacter sp. 172403-2]|uniref:hypothetical protein n=1 Tax=Pontibacter rufus TaxID=2791028 RepID=UPI0018B00AC9|nr:hypothetical protein [Pontibacter sp. 172403-2]MBF9252584.1 hypothetical protein [Pontibacter sp. 172403-2]